MSEQVSTTSGSGKRAAGSSKRKKTEDVYVFTETQATTVTRGEREQWRLAVKLLWDLFEAYEVAEAAKGCEAGGETVTALTGSVGMVRVARDGMDDKEWC